MYSFCQFMHVTDFTLMHGHMCRDGIQWNQFESNVKVKYNAAEQCCICGRGGSGIMITTIPRSSIRTLKLLVIEDNICNLSRKFKHTKLNTPQPHRLAMAHQTHVRFDWIWFLKYIPNVLSSCLFFLLCV